MRQTNTKFMAFVENKSKNVKSTRYEYEGQSEISKHMS